MFSEMEDGNSTQLKANSYSTSDVPPIVPRRDLRSLGLRRYHSSNPSNAERPRSEKPYESEYDKLNRFLRNSISAKTRPLRHESDSKQPIQEMSSSTRQRSRTQVSLQPEPLEYDEDVYLAAEEIATLPNQTTVHNKQRSLSASPLSNTNKASYPADVQPQNKLRYVAHPPKKTDEVETAIYGTAQGKRTNLVMELKELQRAAKDLYRQLLSTNTNSPRMADLRNHLRTGDKAPVSDIMQSVYRTLKPPEPLEMSEDEDEEIYVLDFHDCADKSLLREKILQLFAIPGPPSVAYQKVTARIDSVIHNFVEMIVKMRVTKNETLVSPFHALSMLQSAGQEGEQIVRALQSNELWIRWGTETGLPPLSHIYMLKHPPTYEMRKAIVLSMIGEKRDIIKAMLSGQNRPEIFIPPIYSKLNSEEDDVWQVTEYNPETKKFETHETAIPQWIKESAKLMAHLKSGNRSSFKRGDHIYALYSVYLIVIKDITLTEGSFIKESRMPSNNQIYVGSSTTGVLYRFINVENNHCENIRKILDHAATLKSFRCHQDFELVEACLALSWIRHQPRAVFVINSFQEGDMTNLSLNKKRPFHDKMTALEQHYTYSKKLGPTNDMRHGMNRLGDKISP